MLDWPSVTIADVSLGIYDGPHATPKKTDAGPVFLGIWNLVNGRIELSKTDHLSEESFQKWTRRITPKSGDVVFSYETRLGEAGLIPERLRCCLGRRMALIRPDTDAIEPRFLLYMFLGPAFQEEIRARTVHGSTVDRIPLLEFPRFPLLLPPLEEQRAIASVLGSLDDKIELNRRMNRTLEEMAAAIFKAWFVDFEPVRAKASGAASFPGMPGPIFDALPATFADSELGPIPEGWEAVKLGDQAEVIKGRSYKSSELEPSSTALVTLKSFQRGGGYRPDGLKPYTGIYKPEQVVKPGDLVVAYTDLTQAAVVIGKPAIVRGDSRYDTLVASLDLGIVRPMTGLSVPYLYCLFRTDDFQTHVYGHSNGSTVLHLGKDGVPSYLMPLPPMDIRAAFDAFAVPAFQQIDRLSRESATLAETRDALLPKLLSGEVRVSQLGAKTTEAVT